jgi:hypothetical protein
VVLPYIQGGPNGLVALIEIASPVGYNDQPNIHLIFYTNDCKRAESTSLEETVNDIGFVDPKIHTKAGQNGLVLVAAQPAFGNALAPLQSPIHSRVYEFNPGDGRSRVLEPIIIDAYEFGLGVGRFPHTSKLWSPLRTGATFYAPFEGIDPTSGKFIHTQLTFICPRDTIQGGADAPFGTSIPIVVPAVAAVENFTTTGFPQIDPPFWTASSSVTGLPLFGFIYDVDEFYFADVVFTCDCLSPDVPVNSLAAGGVAYSSTNAENGTFTEVMVVQSSTFPNGALRPGSFSAYRDVFTDGSALNKFFGRTSTGSVGALQSVPGWESR